METNVREQNVHNLYNEVYGILLALGNDFISKVPKNVLKNITSNMTYVIKNGEKKYNVPKFNLKISLNVQGVSKEALAIIYYIYYNYWCSSEKEKIYLDNLIKNNNVKSENIKKEKYSTVDLFSKENKSTEKEENLMIPVKEESWYKKIILMIFDFFKGN